MRRIESTADGGRARSSLVFPSPYPQEVAVSQDRISRRRLLKRIGGGAAIAWSTPILTSIRTPAFAQSGFGCDPGQSCSPCPPVQPCHGNDGCQCWMLSPDQGKACWCGFFAQGCEAECLSQAGCPPGFRCVQTCCGQICVPPCQSRPRAPRRSGMLPRTVRAGYRGGD